MTTLYEKINTTCKYGYYAIVHNPEGVGAYRIVSPNKDAHGLWRETGPCKSFDIATESLGSSFGYTPIQWAVDEAKGWVYAGVYHPPSPKPYEVGQKVRVSEMIKDYGGFDDWDELRKGMTGKIYEIRNVRNCAEGLYYNIYTQGEFCTWTFRHEWLEPVFEDEEVGTKEKPKTIIIDGQEYDLIPKE
jgi:hypothetical protein